MGSFEDVLLGISDDDLMIDDTSKPNPVESHLAERLNYLEDRVQRARVQIEETRNVTCSVLKSLHSQARYEDGGTSEDEDLDLYTTEGLQRPRKRREIRREEILRVRETWKRIFGEKIVVGAVLRNSSTESVTDVRFYVDVKEEPKISGCSILWSLMDDTWYNETDFIGPQSDGVLTLVVDLPDFGKDSRKTCDCIIAYRVDEREYQTPIETFSVSAVDIIDSDLSLGPSVSQSVLTLKSVSVDKTVRVDIERDPGRGAELINFLQALKFQEICEDIYLRTDAGSLMYCLVEILPMIDGEARLRFSCRSETQMNLIIRLLKDQFADLIVQDQDQCKLAAEALIAELKSYLHDDPPAERQRARIKVDLLIP